MVLLSIDTCLQALHIFCQVDVTLCMPSNSPVRFAQCLAPYLKVQPLENGASEAQKRRAAEKLLCILAILTALLGALERLPADLAHEMQADLEELINKHHFVQVCATQRLTCWYASQSHLLCWLYVFCGCNVHCCCFAKDF